MKKTIILAILFFVMVPSFALANDWVFVGSSNVGNKYYIDIDEMYYDRSSGKLDRNMVIAHEKNVLSPSEIAKFQSITRKSGRYHSGWNYLTYVLTFYQYDISNKTYATKYVAFMNQNDNIIAEYRQNPLKFQPIPNGLDYKEYELIIQNLHKVKE